MRETWTEIKREFDPTNFMFTSFSSALKAWSNFKMAARDDKSFYDKYWPDDYENGYYTPAYIDRSINPRSGV